MIPESSSDAQEKEVMPVVSSMEAEPSNAEPSTHQEPVEQVSKSHFCLPKSNSDLWEPEYTSQNYENEDNM